MTDAAVPVCSRCRRQLSAEKPVRLPDARAYCKACCEGMAGDEFEMETGESFTSWIEKHPALEMKYQPLEIGVRRVGFLFPLVLSLLGLALIAYNGALTAAAAGRAHLGLLAVGLAMLLFFGALALRGARAYLRAMGFRITLSDGVFELRHGSRTESFHIDEVRQACVVRPGTVGATEGALGLQDGRMLTLDTCLSDLHALRVVMDLRFREDFPPSADELAKVRRDKLRKIRGLSD